MGRKQNKRCDNQWLGSHNHKISEISENNWLSLIKECYMLPSACHILANPRKKTAAVRTAALHTFGQISALTAWLTGYAIFSQTSALSLAPRETSGPLVNNPRTHEPPVTHWLGGWYSVCGSTLCDGHVVEAAQSQRCIWAAQQSQGVGTQRSGVWVLRRVRVALQKILGFGHCNLLVLDQRGHNKVDSGKHW